MILLRAFVFIIIISVFTCVNASKVEALEKKMALVVGAAGYKVLSQLRKSTSDALDVGNSLKAGGYDVTFATKVTSSDGLKKSIEMFASKVRNEAKVTPVKVVFYYSGHAVESAGSNWLLGPDFDPDGATELKNRALFERYGYDISKAAKLMKLTGASSVLFILDACRSRDIPIGGGKRAAPGIDTRDLNAIGNFQMLYAAASGSIAYEHTTTQNSWRNSVYTHFLLKYMSDIGNISDLNDRIQDEVRDVTAHEKIIQRPSYYDEYSGAYSIFNNFDGSEVAQSGPVLRVFYRDGRSNDARRLGRAMRSVGLFVNLVPDDLRDIQARRAQGTLRVVTAEVLERQEQAQLAKTTDLLELMSNGQKVEIRRVKSKDILSKPFQVQLF